MVLPMLERAGLMGDPTVKAEELALKLAHAIELGDKVTAIDCAGRLADLYAPVTVQLKQEAYPKQDIRLRVNVEDAGLKVAPITLTVRADMTLASLKDLIFQDYKFHPIVQQWVIGKRLPRDSETLHSHGIRTDDDTAYLYIKSAKEANLNHALLEQEVILEPRGTGTLADQLEMLHIYGQDADVMPATIAEKPRPAAPEPPQVGWQCPGCTLINKPTRPGCEMCSTERPEGYVVPDFYQPDEEERARLQKEQQALMQYEQQERERTEDLLQALILQQLQLLETDGVVTDNPGETILTESGAQPVIPPPVNEQPPA